jgi:hypothetical protein
MRADGGGGKDSGGMKTMDVKKTIKATELSAVTSVSEIETHRSP